MCGKYGVGFSAQIIIWVWYFSKIMNMDLKVVIFRLKNKDLGAIFGKSYKYGPKNGACFGGFGCTPTKKSGNLLRPSGITYGTFQEYYNQSRNPALHSLKKM